MPRARLLKPSFFSNDALGEVEPLGRLLFAGLWCLADRDGRLQDRPRRIKAEVLPYDEVDVDHLLDELALRSFVVRYEVEGQRFIQVTAFARHQRPHHKEPPSVIPPSMAQARPEHEPSTARASSKHESITGTDDAELPSEGTANLDAMTGDDCAELEPSTGHASAKQGASCSPLTLNQIQIQKPIPEADPDPVAVADPGPPAEDPVPLLLRHWERATGTTVTPALADWLDSELGRGTPADWLRDAIAETGANGSKAWKYTKAIVERWRVQGREPKGERDVRGGKQPGAGRRGEAPCRASGKYHDWPKLDGWCPACELQEPITEESLRRRGRL